MKTCGSCRHFDNAGTVDLSPNAVGECRRNPPQAFPIPAPGPRGFQTFAVFPPVRRAFVCGEFAQKLEVVS